MVGIVSTIMTILILVVSEIIPKTIGATYWKQLANFTTKALKVMIFPIKMDRNFMAFTINHKINWRKRSWKCFKQRRVFSDDRNG